MYKGIAIGGPLDGKEIECEFKSCRTPKHKDKIDLGKPCWSLIEKIVFYKFDGKNWRLA